MECEHYTLFRIWLDTTHYILIRAKNCMLCIECCQPHRICTFHKCFVSSLNLIPLYPTLSLIYLQPFIAATRGPRPLFHNISSMRWIIANFIYAELIEPIVYTSYGKDTLNMVRLIWLSMLSLSSELHWIAISIHYHSEKNILIDLAITIHMQ